jgi:anti-sigma factor ChrR (cupin superfamily)
MRINADFSERVVVHREDYEWVSSPMPGVERMMLDRIGNEVARATSLVRYAPNSSFSAHTHGGGEEFLVLDGVFADEHQAYPVGSYVRNPIGTSHTPKVGAEGCVILVKLHQFENEDQATVAIDTKNGTWQAHDIDGIELMPLHEFDRERVAMVRWAPDTAFTEHTHWGGEEVFVIEGVFYDEFGEYPAGTWIRSPDQSKHKPFTKKAGALVWVKSGHLPEA